MRKKTVSLIMMFCVLLIPFLLAGCMEENGYYEPAEQAIIDNLTKSKGWERYYHTKLDNGEEFDVHEIWIFKDNGSGSCKHVTTYKNGESKENITYFHWAFLTPDFSVIYMDYELFWEIEELTSNKLNIYETYKDPVTVPGQTYRDYQQYESCNWELTECLNKSSSYPYPDKRSFCLSWSYLLISKFSGDLCAAYI